MVDLDDINLDEDVVLEGYPRPSHDFAMVSDLFDEAATFVVDVEGGEGEDIEPNPAGEEED